MANLKKLAHQLERISIPGLAWDSSKRAHIDIVCHPTVFIRDGQLFVSVEDGKNFADAYGEFSGGYPWIHPELEKWAKKHNGYWEWQNAGCIVLVIG